MLTEVIDKKTFKSTQILETNSFYVVVYNGKPFNYRKISLILNPEDSAAKYKKMAFSQRGRAELEAEKLNKLFKTDLFTVIVFGDDPDAEPVKRLKRTNHVLKVKPPEDPAQ